MQTHVICLHPLGKEIRVNHLTPLVDALHEFGIEFPCGGQGTCGKCKVRLLNGEIKITPQHRDKLARLSLSGDWRLACMSQCTANVTLEVGQFSQIILADESKFDFVPEEGFGIAVDLGTTTVVAQLIDLYDARVMAVETMLNPQVKYGADLISRIRSYVEGSADDMTRDIRSSVGKMIDRMLFDHQVEIKKIVLVGNTAMQRIFAGCDVAPLSAWPFDIDDPGMKLLSSEELGWRFSVYEPIRFYPSIGSFVGSDVLAGIAAVSLHTRERYAALIDLGTNGEIVIGNRERLVCASTAAGPAFEGANISMGMRAVTGAVSSFGIDDGQITARVIGNTTPKGICGSALTDAVAVLRKLGRIGPFGEIVSGDDHVALTGGITLTQKDIHEFQLAKAAIAAGLSILSAELSISPGDIGELYLAGGFGNYINPSHVVETGMIELPVDKIRKMGNTALIGAKMFLFENGTISNEILRKTTHINLERNPNFQDIFVDKMIL